MPKQACRRCGYRMDQNTEAYGDDSRPSPGDVSMCLRCGALSVFTEAITLRAPTGEENESLQRDSRITELQIMRAAVMGGALTRTNKNGREPKTTKDRR